MTKNWAGPVKFEPGQVKIIYMEGNLFNIAGRLSEDLSLKYWLQWNFNRNTKLFIHENASESIVPKMAAILTMGQWVNRICYMLSTRNDFWSHHDIRLNRTMCWSPHADNNYSDVTWASWLLKSPATWLSVPVHQVCAKSSTHAMLIFSYISTWH